MCNVSLILHNTVHLVGGTDIQTLLILTCYMPSWSSSSSCYISSSYLMRLLTHTNSVNSSILHSLCLPSDLREAEIRAHIQGRIKVSVCEHSKAAGGSHEEQSEVPLQRRHVDMERVPRHEGVRLWAFHRVRLPKTTCACPSPIPATTVSCLNNTWWNFNTYIRAFQGKVLSCDLLLLKRLLSDWTVFLYRVGLREQIGYI